MSANRRVTEELLYRIKKEQAGRIDAAAAEAETSLAQAREPAATRELVGRGGRRASSG